MIKFQDENHIRNSFSMINKREKKHPVYYFCYHLYWNTIRYLTELPYKIKYFFQRGKNGIAVEDCWALDSYLADIIVKGVIWLKKNSHGLPTWRENKQVSQAKKEWNDILDNIIYTFKTAKEITNGDTWYIPLKKWNKKEYYRLKKQDFTKVLTLKQTRKLEKGFDLFKEYYFALWD